MDVAVDSKRGQPRLRANRVAESVLGDGMLVRARAISLGLLGLTAAVGLAIVALAFNQGWPLIAGSSIPRIPPRHQDIAEATVAASGTSETGRRLERPAGRSAAGRSAGEGGAQAGSADSAPGSSPAGSNEPVVSPSTPARSGGGNGGASPKKKAPTPAVQQPQTQSAPASSPASEQASAPSASPGATAPAAPTATVSEAPDGGNTPSWSNGNGHAYGRSDSWGGHGHDWDGADRDWGDDDRGHGWHD